MNIAAVVKQIREEKEISQTELAKRAGIDSTHVSHIECGTRTPSIATLTKLATALEVPEYMFLKEPRDVEAIHQNQQYIKEIMDPIFAGVYKKLETFGMGSINETN